MILVASTSTNKCKCNAMVIAIALFELTARGGYLGSSGGYSDPDAFVCCFVVLELEFGFFGFGIELWDNS